MMRHARNAGQTQRAIFWELSEPDRMSSSEVSLQQHAQRHDVLAQQGRDPLSLTSVPLR